MIESGDWDRYYYNDFCYRVSDYDIPFNLIISNLVYMIHGLILAWAVWMMEAGLLAWCHRHVRHQRSRFRLPEGQDELPNHCVKCPCIDAHLANMPVPHLQAAEWWWSCIIGRRSMEMKEQFLRRLFFCMGSHLRRRFLHALPLPPNEVTFQFDSAFMFVILGLIVLILYSGTSFKECAIDWEFQLPVHSNNFFLFFIVLLYIFNYFSSLYSLGGSYLSVGMTFFFSSLLV